MAKLNAIRYEILNPSDVDELPDRLTIRLKEAIDEGDEWMLVRSTWPLDSVMN